MTVMDSYESGVTVCDGQRVATVMTVMRAV